MSNIQKQHKISPAIAWLTIQKFIIFYCPLDGEHTKTSRRFLFYFIQIKISLFQNLNNPKITPLKIQTQQLRKAAAYKQMNTVFHHILLPQPYRFSSLPLRFRRIFPHHCSESTYTVSFSELRLCNHLLPSA